jgi:outer membrane protein assembly factor BamB
LIRNRQFGLHRGTLGSHPGRRGAERGAERRATVTGYFPALCVVGAVVVLASGCGSTPKASAQPSGSSVPVSAASTIPSWEWPTYAHDAQHTGHGQTLLTPASVTTLAPAWAFPTGDAVTATPTVVDGTVYVGSWDGWFYAIDFATGALRWKFQLQAQHGVVPYPGQQPRDSTSDGGLVTSSAWYEPGSAAGPGQSDPGRPDLVIFGGGYTLYALNARTGGLYWKHDYTGRPDRPPNPATDDTRIFSSPVVVGHAVLFGVDTDGEPDSRGYVVSASLATGDPLWEYQVDVDGRGRIENNGCGNVWSSGTVLPGRGLVVFDSADCNFGDPPPTSESVFALRIADGTLAWRFRPVRTQGQCDLDFGASVNAGLSADGRVTFLGAGSKDGTYYSLDSATGRLLWSSNVVFGGFAGGFIGTTAFDGSHVYGSTALGDAGHIVHGVPVQCDPGNPKDVSSQEPSVHAFDAATGAVTWQDSAAASFGPTTVAGSMTFNCPSFGADVQVRASSSGALLDQATLPSSCWSGIATVGDALVLGFGSSASASPAGVVLLTPGGAPPRVPRAG